MTKFLLLLEGLAPQLSATDTQTQDYNKKWREWIWSLAGAGTLDGGLPLAPTATEVTKDAVSERELATRDVYGYLIINAGTLDEAIIIARSAPHTELGGTTIIRPCIEPPLDIAAEP